MKHCFVVLVVLAVLTAVPARAQEWSSEQLAVWETVQSSWDMEKNKQDWCAEVCHANLLAWGHEFPAPRNADQTSIWLKRGFENSTALENTLSPLAIVVQGDMGFAHYYYTTLSEGKDGKRTIEHGRYTDVLVNDGGKWKFITWHGGKDSEE
jgi:hypothetical protein